MLSVPFFANPDDTHCYQAVIRMILKRFLPDRDFTWADLDRVTGKQEGRWTWPLYSMLQLKDMGFEIINMEYFDYHRFAREGSRYLLEMYGEEVGTAQIQHSNIPYEMKNAELFMRRFRFRPSVPDLNDLRELLRDGYLLVCNVNICALNGEDGYSGHFVLVYGVDESGIVFHDPGPPPGKSRKVPRDLFAGAWAYPTETEKNLMAFRYPG